MTRTNRLAGLVVAGALLGLSAGCLDDGGGGGGGGGGTVNFITGFAFVRDDNQDIYVADRSDYTTVGRLTTSGGNRQPSLSADGRQVVFVHTDAGGTSSIMTVATNGGGAPRTVYTANAAGGEKNFKNPVFSPDGTTIVFAYEVLTTSYLAKVAAADGSGFTALTSGPLSYASPSFYPASSFPGEVLAAAGNSIGQYTLLERININTLVHTPVTNDLGAEAASITNRAVLSADGTKVAFDARLASASTATRIFVQVLSTGVTTQVSDTGAGSTEALHAFPTWVSPTQVAFVSNEGGANQVYIQGISALGTGNLTLPSANQPWFGP